MPTKIVISVLAISILAGCATATKYGPITDSGGYKDKELGQGVYFVEFWGNALISSEKVAEYFLKRSAEVCSAAKFTHFYVADTWDTSSKKDFIQTNTYTTPVYTNHYGYTSYSYGGQSYSTSTPVTYTYPSVQGRVVCENSQDSPFLGVKLQRLTKDDASKTGVKDFLAALQVTEAVLEPSPFIRGDVITKVDGIRLEFISDLVFYLREKKATQVSVEIYREGNKKIIKADTAIISAQPVAKFLVDKNEERKPSSNQQPR